MNASYEAYEQQRNRLYQNPFSVKMWAHRKSPLGRDCDLRLHIFAFNKSHSWAQSFLAGQSNCQNLTEFSRFPRGYAVGCRPIWSDEHLLEPVPEQEVEVGQQPIG